MADERVSWEEYFMDIAQAIATRATCPKRKVGAILVRDRMILSGGYNGSMRGAPHCDDPAVGCLLDGAGKCRRTIHAEANAILQAARNGVTIDGAICVVTRCPCWNCYKLLSNSGVTKVIYLDGAQPWVEIEGWGHRVNQPLNDCEAPGMALFRYGDNGARC
jgi:dCMP deaminase